MLQIKPEDENATGTEEKSDDALYCAGCGHLVTRARWKISLGGTERPFTNPLGISFTVVCFSDAPGAVAEGAATEQDTWFHGYEWCFALCRGCKGHLGWHYRNAANSDEFFGLIKNRLSSRPG